MGKIVAAFVFFLAASALAVHEAKPPPVDAAPSRVVPVDEPPPSRAIHDAVPPWVKYAPPPIAPPPPVIVEPPRPGIAIEPTTITIDDGESADVPDAVDKCPDQPSDSDDDDGCPQPIIVD